MKPYIAPALVAFLDSHRASSMSLRANLFHSGMAMLDPVRMEDVD